MRCYLAGQVTLGETREALNSSVLASTCWWRVAHAQVNSENGIVHRADGICTQVEEDAEARAVSDRLPWELRGCCAGPSQPASLFTSKYSVVLTPTLVLRLGFGSSYSFFLPRFFFSVKGMLVGGAISVTAEVASPLRSPSARVPYCKYSVRER